MITVVPTNKTIAKSNNILRFVDLKKRRYMASCIKYAIDRVDINPIMRPYSIILLLIKRALKSNAYTPQKAKAPGSSKYPDILPIEAITILEKDNPNEKQSLPSTLTNDEPICIKPKKNKTKATHANIA